MAKEKMNFCVAFSLCLFLLLGSGASDQSQNSDSDSTQTSIQALESQMSLILKRLESVEKGKEELEKSNEELKQQVESLSEKLSELESQISEDHGLWLLTPPVRGPPGKDGQQGEKGVDGQGFPDPESVTSCNAAMTLLPFAPQRLSIYPHEDEPSRRVEVLCDFETDGVGWTIIQKRTSGPKEEFYQNWDEYVNGFGSLEGNFWIGLDNIHALTENGDQELRIDLEDFEGNKRFAISSSFSISDESDYYRLSIGGFHSTSTAGDSMTGSWNLNGSQFTTKDNENDGGDRNCAVDRKGAWWYRSVDRACAHSNLNGMYRQPGESFSPGHGLVWETWRRSTTSLKKVQMKIRNRN